MVSIRVLFYTHDTPKGILEEVLTGETRSDIVQQVIQRIEEIERKIGARTLKCKFLDGF